MTPGRILNYAAKLGLRLLSAEPDLLDPACSDEQTRLMSIQVSRMDEAKHLRPLFPGCVASHILRHAVRIGLNRMLINREDPTC